MKRKLCLVLFLFLFSLVVNTTTAVGAGVLQSCSLITSPSCGQSWDYSMGYKFTPNTNGQITNLCGYFSGTKTVKLYDSSYNVLASASVTSSNSWSCTSITPISVTSGSAYYVVAEIGGSGGCMQSPISLPTTCGNIVISANVYQTPSGTFTASHFEDTTSFYGIADVVFSPTTSYTLSVSKTGSGTGTVTSNPAGINCGATCSASYNSGTSVTLTATPDSGSTFTGWSGDCTGTGTCIVSMTSAKSVTASFTASTSISNCAELNQAGNTYTLTASFTNNTVTANRACINITANNITFNCQGYNIDSNDTSNTYGIHIARTSITDTNITVKNCNVTNWYNGIYLYNARNNTLANNTANSNGDSGIYFVGSSNNNLTNNAANSNYYGIHLFSNSNNNILTNNAANYNSYGIRLSSSSNNNITGGSVALSSTSDYYLSSAGATNNFTNTNFTALRKIQFGDATSWFNYNNQTTGNIWLKTNISSGTPIITRNLANWSQTNMSWNEASSASVTANYTLTGLVPSKPYTIYSIFGSKYILNYTQSTDASGALNFNITLNTTARMIMVNTTVSTGDTPPYFSANATNTTVAGKPANFTINVTDNANLGSTAEYIFSTNNSGTWINSSYQSFAGSGLTLTAWNVTTLNSTVGALSSGDSMQTTQATTGTVLQSII